MRQFAQADLLRFLRVRLAIPAALVQLIQAGLVILAIALVTDTVRTILKLHSALPYFDEWDSLTLYALMRSGYPLTHLFDQHNEHRIFFPRLILFSDYLVFKGRGILDLVTIFAIQTAHAGMLLALLRACRPRASGSLGLAAVVVILLFSLRQEENFSWGFQVQFVGVFAVATLTFTCFAMAVARMRRGSAFGLPLAAAFAGVVVATFTLASGVLSGIVLVILAILAGVSRKVTLGAAGLTIGLAAAYLYGYTPNPDHTSLSQALSQPVRLAYYILAYLGNFLDPDIGPAAALGACGLLGAAGIFWRFATGRDGNPVRLALLGILLFTLGTDAITALGRVGYGVDQAMASRYATVSGSFWSALLIAWWSLSGSARYWLAVRGGLVVSSAILLAGAYRAQSDDKPGMEDRAYAQEQSTNALLQGFEDLEVFGGVYDRPDMLKTYASFLRQEDISIFSEPDARLFHQPLAQAGFIVDPASCTGSFGAASGDSHLGPNGLRVAGHAVDARTGQPVRRVYLVDAEDHVVGYASGGIREGDGDAWTGYATALPQTSLRAFARLGPHRLCAVGTQDVTQ